MSDLISRKEAIEAIRKMDLEFMQQADVQKCISDKLSRIPTAYDVDKVVERISSKIRVLQKLNSEDEIVDVAIKELQWVTYVVKGAVKDE